jgi:DNA-binding response OmpR family regulator
MTYKKTALVGDESGDVRKVHREILESLGFLTLEADDGFQLLERLRRVRPSLIVVDLDLRGLDGTEVLHFVRRNEDWMDIPVLVTSSRTDASARRLVRQCGGSAFVGRPCAPETLREVVRALLLPERRRSDVESDPGERRDSTPVA